MAYLNQLSPEVLKLLSTDPNAKWTDPSSGAIYYGNWSAPTQGNDENPALPAQFLNSVFGIPSLSAPDGSQMATYGPQGQLYGYGQTGVQTDFMDRVAPFMAAGILGAGLGAGMGLFGEGAGGAAATGAGEAAGGSGAFLGEGMASGVPAWDAAATNAGLSLSGTAGVAPTALNSGNSVPSDLFPEESPWTPTPNAQPLNFPSLPSAPPGTNSVLDAAKGLIPDAAKSVSSLLGPAASLLGAAAGSQGTQVGGTGKMDPRLDSAVFGQGGVVPSAQGLLSSQMPTAAQYGGLLGNVGTQLVNTPINPNIADNPYMQSAADDISRRTQQLLGQNNAQIQGNFVGAGGLGGSRQGVAQGLAAGQAADSLQGNLSNLYYNQYNADANRNLQKIGQGAALLSGGLDIGWQPARNAASVYQPFTGYGVSPTTQGGGWLGALGGALGGAQLAKNFGWPGGQNTGSSSGSWW